MDAKQFGRLLGALRREHIDLGPPEKIWSQARLAQEAGLSRSTIEDIEQGKPKRIYPDILLALAKALELNAGERREFFFAANGIRNRQLAPDRSDPEALLEHCLEILGTVHAPAFLLDPYYDVIATNTAALYLFNMQKMLFLDWKSLENPPNLLAFLCNRDLSPTGNFDDADHQEFIELI